MTGADLKATSVGEEERRHEATDLRSNKRIRLTALSPQEALVQLRSGACDRLHVGDSWDLDENTRVTLLRKPFGCPGDGHSRIVINARPSLPTELYAKRSCRVALCDFVARAVHDAIASTPAALSVGLRFTAPGQYVLERSSVRINPSTGVFSVVVTLRRGQGRLEGEADKAVRAVVRKALVVSRDHTSKDGLDMEAVREHVKSVEDQRHLRGLVAVSEGIAFIADGAILPRRSSADNRPMEGPSVVPFMSPMSLRHEFELPHAGKIQGMLVPRGVTVIVGGGYHGKSTLLRTLSVGVYDKVPGDGRELAVADPGSVAVRAEDGRPVSGVDISPFIGSLPSATRGTGVGVGVGADPAWFSSGEASGSTSQAAGVVEALEAGATALLLDEDTCAGNFMIRDSRMRAMVHHEPITPFIYRVSSLWLQKGVSSVIVVGGCGDYFDVHDTAILVDSYAVTDATERAHSISRRFCVGRVQYAGRGLVKRLPWTGDPALRALVPGSLPLPWPVGAAQAAADQKRTLLVPVVKRREAGGVDKGGGDIKDLTPEKKCDDDHSEETGEGTRNEGGRGGERGRGRSQEEDGEDEEVGCPHCKARYQTGIVSSGGGAGARMVGLGGRLVDLSRLEQLVGGAAQARGCALGVAWVARETERHPGLSVGCALDRLDTALGAGEGDGLQVLLGSVEPRAGKDAGEGQGGLGTWGVGEAAGEEVTRPRRFEVAAMLHRFPGVKFVPTGRRGGTSGDGVEGEKWGA
ncbi:unnamed protein product [Discosporangium mesarthrocarpum]